MRERVKVYAQNCSLRKTSLKNWISTRKVKFEAEGLETCSIFLKGFEEFIHLLSIRGCKQSNDVLVSAT